jgi:drug/metabolite transporter (DMT)-like permease
MQYPGKPTLRLFVGATMISFSPVWVRLVNVSPTTSGFYRVLIGGVALGLFLIVTRQRLQLSRKVWLILVGSSVFFALDLWFWHRSINYIGPGLATLLANFQVFFMMLAGVVLLRQRPRPIQLAAVPLALIGLGMIVGFDWQNLPGDYRLGIIFGLLTAVVYAGYMLTMRASAYAEGASLAIPTVTDATWLVAYGLVSHCLGLLFIASSLPKVSTTEAGLALLLQPTLSFVWDVLFFARPTTPTELAGATIALVAIYLGSRQNRRS